jgi:hypothetical protein
MAALQKFSVGRLFYFHRVFHRVLSTNVSMARSSTTFNSKTARTNNHTPEVEKKRAETKSVHKLIKGEIYNELRKAIIDSEGNKKPFYQEYIHKLCKEGLKDPNSPIGRLWAEQLLQQDIISMLDEQTERNLNKDIDFTQFRLQKRLFKEQKDVFNDFTSRRKLAMCSRRAGKTEGNVDEILKVAAKPDSRIVYINLTFDNAIEQMYDKVIEEAKRCDIVISSDDKNSGIIHFANGSTCHFKGNKDRAQADKLQGFGNRLVIIDEAQSQINMNYLIDTIISPTLMDYEDSVLLLTGTPPRRKGTYFEAAWNSPVWTKYSWTMFQNPYIKNPDAEINRKCDEKGITRESAFIQREFFGKIVYDTEAQVFKGYKVYKDKVPLDFTPTHIYIGVDFGYADYNGVVCLAANVDQRRAYVTFERKFNHATITEIIDNVKEGFESGKRLLLERNPSADLSNCAIFTDNNEKSITYELSQTYGLPAYCAYKYNKAMAIEQLADYCRSGKIVIPENGAIADEYEQTLYKRDDLDNITSEIDDSYHPDITMALLYASRQFFFDCGEETGGESKNKQTGEF